MKSRNGSNGSKTIPQALTVLEGKQATATMLFGLEHFRQQVVRLAARGIRHSCAVRLKSTAYLIRWTISCRSRHFGCAVTQ